jgi:DNA transformation protein
VAVSEEFRLFVLDQLGMVTRVHGRRMFGGLGIYAGELFFALAAADVLYLKADEKTIPEFEAAGMKPFRPFGPDEPAMGYWELPPDVLEDVDALARWVDAALAVAARAGEKKSRRGGRPGARVARSPRGRGVGGRGGTGAKRR